MAGGIPVHKNEFVGNHAGVANPHVKQFYDIFDVAQKNGTIHMINTTQILDRLKPKAGNIQEVTVQNLIWDMKVLILWLLLHLAITMAKK